MSTTQSNSDWETIVEYLHYSGAKHGQLTPLQETRVRLLGDGYADLADSGIQKELSDNGISYLELLWDWSHVRDSTPHAMKRMADEIRNLAD